MDDQVSAYTRAVVILAGVGAIIYVVVSQAPNSGTDVGVIVAAVGSLLGLIQTQVTHAKVDEIHAAVADGTKADSVGQQR